MDSRYGSDPEIHKGRSELQRQQLCRDPPRVDFRLVSRSDWGSNYYGAKKEGRLSKYYYNSSTGGWVVTSKNGTTYYYGTTSASRQDFNSGANVFKWCLDKVQDLNGNTMTVTYYKDQGEILSAGDRLHEQHEQWE